MYKKCKTKKWVKGVLFAGLIAKKPLTLQHGRHSFMTLPPSESGYPSRHFSWQKVG